VKKATRKKTPPKKSVVKRTGRPRSTGSGSALMVRMHKPQLKAIDTWIADSGLSRPEAVRQLVNFALAHTKPDQEPAAAHRTHEEELHR
jgi:hypothetical protein